MFVVARVMLLLIAFTIAQEAEETDIIYLTEPYTVENRKIDCIEVVKTDADLKFEQADDNPHGVCGTFFAGDIDDVISIEVLDSNINCDDDETLETDGSPDYRYEDSRIVLRLCWEGPWIFDGWATQNGTLPNEIDHEIPLSDRVMSYCSWVRGGRRGSFFFTSTQNIALAQYQLKLETFVSFRFRKVHNDNPKCHVVAPTSEGEYKMTSVRGRNCTFSIIQPTQLLVKKVRFGDPQKHKSNGVGAIEIRNGNSLDTTSMEVIHKFTDSVDGEDIEVKSFFLEKTHTAIRMTSSNGFHDNVIVFRYTNLVQDTAESEACQP